MNSVPVAAVQASPVFLNRDATVEKACALIDEAVANGAGLVVFPEAFVPAYPDWVWRLKPWEMRAVHLQSRLFREAMVVGDESTEALAEAASRGGAYVSIGINERDASSSTLFSTQLTLDPSGAVVGKHRKLMPTGAERLVWGMGDGSSLNVTDTPFGRLGGLTSWDNYMPLARAAVYAQGADVYLAPTWDNSDTWVSTLRHIAKEGRLYVVGVNSCIRASDIPADVPARDELYGEESDWLTRGNSAIVGPEGDVLAGPIMEREGILYAELDVEQARTMRHQFDPVGHYSRPDILRLFVDTGRRAPVTFGRRHES